MTDKHDDLPALPEPAMVDQFSLDAAFTEDQAREIRQAAYSAGQRAAALRAAEVCMEQAKEPECPERAAYCADAILRDAGIDKEQSNG